jgi:predicted PurR-regulated permease PerM
MRLAIAAVVAGLLLLMLRDWWLLLPGTLTVVGLALFAALAAEPVIAWAAERHLPRGVSIAVLAAITLGLTTVITIAVLPAAVAQLEAFRVGLPELMQQLIQNPAVIGLQSTLGTSIDLAGIGQGVVDFVGDPQQFAALWGGFLSVSNGVAATVVGAILAFVLSIYFSIELPTMRRGIARFFRLSSREHSMSIVDEIFNGVGRYVAGQIALASLNGVVAFVVVGLVGGPTPILFAVIAFLAAFLPVVGTPLGYGIATVATFAVSPTHGVVVGAILLAYMLLEAYVLVPVVMKRAVRIPATLVLVSALVGASVGGIAGAFFAVPLTGALLIAHRRILVPAQQRR